MVEDTAYYLFGTIFPAKSDERHILEIVRPDHTLDSQRMIDRKNANAFDPRKRFDQDGRVVHPQQ